MEFYANGYKNTHQRQLEPDELAVLKARIDHAAKLFRLHYKLGTWTFYLCLLFIVAASSILNYLNSMASDIITTTLIFCCLCTPFLTCIEEFIFPANRWMRYLYGLFYLVLLSGFDAKRFIPIF